MLARRKLLFFALIAVANGVAAATALVALVHTPSTDWSTLVADKLLGFRGYPVERPPNWFWLRNALATIQYVVYPAIWVLPVTLAAAFLRMPSWIPLIGIPVTFSIANFSADRFSGSDWLQSLVAALYFLVIFWPSLLFALAVYLLLRIWIGRR